LAPLVGIANGGRLGEVAGSETGGELAWGEGGGEPVAAAIGVRSMLSAAKGANVRA
jgi:hypothetical protein